MRTYRCKCGNLKLRKEGEERYPPSGEEGARDENGRSPVVVVRGGQVEILFPSLSKNYVNGITRCLICNVNVYRAIDGDETVEVLVEEGDGQDDQESSAFSASLGLLVPSASSSSATFSPSRPRRFPSPPALPTSYAPPTTLLQTAPEPFFLPHPFSPNHPAFHSITLKVDDHLKLERQRLVDEIASFLHAKRDQFDALSDKTRKDVEEVWKIFEDGQVEREEEERLGGPSGAGGGEMDRIVEGVATPIKTTERFPKELEMSSSISSLPRPTSSTSVGSYKAGFILPPSSSTSHSNSSSALASPTIPRHPSTILSPTSSTNIPPPLSNTTNTSSTTSIPTTGPTSLLSASLSRGSYLLSRPPAYYDDRPRPALEPIPSPPPPSGFTHHPSPPRIETDLDLASSMIASTWQEPANLIFRSNKHHPMPPPPKRKGSHPHQHHEHPETVREEREEAGISRIGGAALGEGAVSASFKEREERMGEQPVAKTPPQSGGRGSNGGGEQEIGFIEEEERRRAGLDKRNAKEGKEVGGAKGKQRDKDGKSPKRKVTFLEPTTSAELEEGEYEEAEREEALILDGNHEEVFDFEEPELPSSSSPSPSPLPIDEASTPLPPFTLLRSTSSSSTITNANLVPTSAPSSSNDILLDSQNDARPSRSIEKDEPMYTLDGRSALRPVPTAKSHSRSPSADRRTEAEKELQGENNRVLVSMKKLTAADLPSHRAAWKDKPRDWQIFGRFGGRPGGGRSVTSSDDGADEEPPSVHYGQSLPVNILPPPGSGSSSKPPLEHKTSYTDEPGALVPPLKAATRGSTTVATNRSSSHSSTTEDLVRRTSSSSGTRRTSTTATAAGSSRSMPPAVMDPGPGLVEDEEDSESTTGAGDSGFVPPHLRGRTEEEQGVLGWASSVVG